MILRHQFGASVPVVTGTSTEGSDMKQYYYTIEFQDGSIVHRTDISKTMAKTVYAAMEYEMLLFRVKRVSWGSMEE